MASSEIIAIVRRYLAALPDYGIHPLRAVLFGSYANGDPNEWSDIDLVIIAPEFDHQHDITLVEQLWRATATDSRIEPIPCGEKEWETDTGRPIIAIARQEGIEIAA
ncbi:MAG: nucleotidyltransferase domain-containing protein [Candidatus Coatesbacteria bacterium]|nr:nucleotidyltransferase domain-containing protein [Candidatus Coatesbacteria bacterium]